jgi:hypothetical protein
MLTDLFADFMRFEASESNGAFVRIRANLQL